VIAFILRLISKRFDIMRRRLFGVCQRLLAFKVLDLGSHWRLKKR